MIITGFTVLYPDGSAQAQMHKKTFSSSASKDEKKPQLFVTRDFSTKDKDEKKSDDETSADDKTAQEIDRIFEKYKALSNGQNEAAAAKPMKEKTLTFKTPPKIAPKEPETKKTGFSGILEQYEKNKANKSKTKTLRFNPPENINN